MFSCVLSLSWPVAQEGCRCCLPIDSQHLADGPEGVQVLPAMCQEGGKSALGADLLGGPHFTAGQADAVPSVAWRLGH